MPRSALASVMSAPRGGRRRACERRGLPQSLGDLRRPAPRRSRGGHDPQGRHAHGRRAALDAGVDVTRDVVDGHEPVPLQQRADRRPDDRHQPGADARLPARSPRPPDSPRPGTARPARPRSSGRSSAQRGVDRLQIRRRQAERVQDQPRVDQRARAFDVERRRGAAQVGDALDAGAGGHQQMDALQIQAGERPQGRPSAARPANTPVPE